MSNKKIFEPLEQQIGQDQTAEFPDGGRVTDEDSLYADAPALVTAGFEIERDPEFFKRQQAENLLFDKELVTIYIHDTAEEQADSNFEIAVNGFKRVFFRNQTYRVPRMFVEGLARAKPVGYRCEEYMHPDGYRAIRYPSRTGLRYGFSVIEDTPKGKQWLKRILAEV